MFSGFNVDTEHYQLSDSDLPPLEAAGRVPEDDGYAEDEEEPDSLNDWYRPSGRGYSA